MFSTTLGRKAIIVPILQMRKLKHNKTKPPDQVDAARKEQNWRLDPACPEPMSLTSIFCKTYVVDD